jgi:hypothetical protein
MRVYLFLSLNNNEIDGDAAVTTQRAVLVTAVPPQTGGTQLGHLLIEEAQREAVRQCQQIQVEVLRSFAQAAHVARTRVERFSADEASHDLYTVTRNELGCFN